jgi:hypothetical protein
MPSNVLLTFDYTLSLHRLRMISDPGHICMVHSSQSHLFGYDLKQSFSSDAALSSFHFSLNHVCLPAPLQRPFFVSFLVMLGDVLTIISVVAPGFTIP